ncbi:hypothetical protein BO82DRAFT_7565 [Aspergillus uvarum CBS 121591]|uniref:Uncharacterized protein n=1 Tax=Aspergillus uvarum CBS 121591 TaxID=1448315 RepID=A0A319CH55_9EURO|nr:hypothetical protein BO82DRAFT_7565 [Aspergillus uvarum CBS 121591]PYH84554.1 hypothetical protein BO82DRAFT_7565 [Aspergillus uvarum CBS 121591]
MLPHRRRGVLVGDGRAVPAHRRVGARAAGSNDSRVPWPPVSPCPLRDSDQVLTRETGLQASRRKRLVLTGLLSLGALCVFLPPHPALPMTLRKERLYRQHRPDGLHRPAVPGDRPELVQRGRLDLVRGGAGAGDRRGEYFESEADCAPAGAGGVVVGGGE